MYKQIKCSNVTTIRRMDMLQVGLREANMHFSKYLKLVKEGQEVVVTERGKPVAVIKPLYERGDARR
ncbi:MAG: type II toxin-antitoxin system prevent-host-death family antitoxin [Candidatus Brocadia sp. AMX2]|nr:MAG: type II toxin-antitoxin system prevent-host-death family antitoxin [Candidatus Brocadia sp. AMX2]MBC6933971.1 type II toxin-antitoxin system prevent-host-death family antitoxin [Candidatus Brocadia sp.]MBL1170199.1 type II toxin-antitoxin system prevent-host-death family antitoxin [Candidatus Brocadia sp. AMX1]MCE7868527.1 type II toxin-antitoxin system prevent-host-death family antitoxin [Candidatus Brocadia sp. AMX2]MCQ3919107.1 type II toxin-antitoxin system prevent-host-death family